MRLTKSEIKYLRSLARKKVRTEEGKFILEGWKPVGEALGSAFEIEMVAVSEGNDNPEHHAVLTAARSRSVPVRELTARELRQVTDTATAQGVVALVRQRRFELTDRLLHGTKLVVVCDAVNDPANLGSIIRSSDWYGVDLVVVSCGSVSLYNEKVVRSTAGSLFHVQVVEEVELTEALPRLRRAGFHIAAAEAGASEPVDAVAGLDRVALVLGNEAHGVRPEVRALADRAVSIPRYGKAESLNVGVAAAILLDRIRRYGSKG